MSKQTPKLQISIQHSCCSMLTREKIEIKKRQRISFRPERWNVPYRNHHTYCEKLWFMRGLYPNLPQMGQKFTTACWCHSMIACQVSCISDELLTTSVMVSVGNVPPLGTKRYPLPLIAFKFSRVNFSDFSVFVWTFLCINWVLDAFMCIIQIWTTCTCSSAYKLVEN